MKVQKVSNPKILDYMKECVSKVERLGYDLSPIQFCEFQSNEHAGIMEVPPKKDSRRCRLGLNTDLYSWDERMIKDVIYHEIAHFLDTDEAISSGDVEWNGAEYATDFRNQHGPNWRKYADQIENATGCLITKTSPRDGRLKI